MHGIASGKLGPAFHASIGAQIDPDYVNHIAINQHVDIRRELLPDIAAKAVLRFQSQSGSLLDRCIQDEIIQHRIAVNGYRR